MTTRPQAYSAWSIQEWVRRRRPKPLTAARCRWPGDIWNSTRMTRGPSTLVRELYANWETGRGAWIGWVERWLWNRKTAASSITSRACTLFWGKPKKRFTAWKKRLSWGWGKKTGWKMTPTSTPCAVIPASRLCSPGCRRFPRKLRCGSLRGGVRGAKIGVGGEQPREVLDVALQVKQPEAVEVEQFHLRDGLLRRPVLRRDAVRRDHHARAVGAVMAVDKDLLLRVGAQQRQKFGDLLIAGPVPTAPRDADIAHAQGLDLMALRLDEVALVAEIHHDLDPQLLQGLKSFLTELAAAIEQGCDLAEIGHAGRGERRTMRRVVLGVIQVRCNQYDRHEQRAARKAENADTGFRRHFRCAEPA